MVRSRDVQKMWHPLPLLSHETRRQPTNAVIKSQPQVS